MNKIDFLRRLDKELSILDKTERTELLGFYEERFYNGMVYENKTEQEVIAELESPEAIARNILEEYGMSPKYIKTKEVKDAGVSNTRVIWLIIIDVFVLSWVIPTVFSVVVALFGTLISYFGVIPLMIGERTIYDEMVFAFLSGGYILIFLLSLAVLELFLWVIKRTVIYHMNVFQFKKRVEYTKRLHKVSVDGWFKRHKMLRFVKNISGVAALVVMVYTGLFLFNNFDEIEAVYAQDNIIDTFDLDVSSDITNSDVWNVDVDSDTLDIVFIPVTGTEIKVTHEYKELYDITVDIDDDSNIITISQVSPSRIFSYNFSLEDLFNLLNRDTLTIEIPQNLLLEDVNIVSETGETKFMDLNVENLEIINSTGRTVVSDVVVNNELSLQISTGEIYVKDSSGNSISAVNTTGTLTLRDLNFITYDLKLDTGEIRATNFNITDDTATQLDCEVDTGNISLKNIYVPIIVATVDTGSVDLENDNELYEINFTGTSDTGNVTSNLD